MVELADADDVPAVSNEDFGEDGLFLLLLPTFLERVSDAAGRPMVLALVRDGTRTEDKMSCDEGFSFARDKESL